MSESIFRTTSVTITTSPMSKINVVHVDLERVG